MSGRARNYSGLIYSAGTQVITTKCVQGRDGRIAQPVGAVAVVVKSPMDRHHTYRVRFTDGSEAALHHDNLVLLAEFKVRGIQESTRAPANQDLFARVIFRCVIGSRAYGLDDADSDIDRRGIYLPPAHLHWSLYGVPEQLENDDAQEAYWELQKFLVLALKANPNLLECLYTPIVELATPLAQELLDMRAIFLSRLVYQTYNGYVMSQFKKMQTDLRNQGRVKWKHVMHLIRLLLSGITVLREAFVPVQVSEHRDALLAIKQGKPSGVKPLLYVYRVLLTGIHLMNIGEIEANLPRLNEAAKLPYIADLIDRKLAGAEKSQLVGADLAFHEAEYRRLMVELETAAANSKLPEAPTGKGALNELLTRLRLKSPGRDNP